MIDDRRSYNLSQFFSSLYPLTAATWLSLASVLIGKRRLFEGNIVYNTSKRWNGEKCIALPTAAHIFLLGSL